MIVYQLWSRPDNNLIGEIFIKGGFVSAVLSAEDAGWTNIKKGMIFKQASRFLANHNGQATYVTTETVPDFDHEPLSKDDGFDLGDGYNLSHSSGMDTKDGWLDNWKLNHPSADIAVGAFSVKSSPESLKNLISHFFIKDAHKGKGIGKRVFEKLQNHYGNIDYAKQFFQEEPLQKSVDTPPAVISEAPVIAPRPAPAPIQSATPAPMAAPTEKPVLSPEPSKRQILDSLSSIESSGGKNRVHAKQNKGIHAGTYSYSSYGLMPVSIRELADKSNKFGASPLGQKIQTIDPVENMPAIHAITDDQKNDDFIAEHLWNYNKNRVAKFAAPEHVNDVSAYAWRYGNEAAKSMYIKEGISGIRNAPYVQKFNMYLKEPLTSSTPASHRASASGDAAPVVSPKQWKSFFETIKRPSKRKKHHPKVTYSPEKPWIDTFMENVQKQKESGLGE